MGWRHAHIGQAGDRLTLDGRRVWQEDWRWVGGKSVTLPNPLEPAQTQSFMICEVGNARRPVRFAASKLPSGLWAFYIPD
jgi:hypothetical protein